MNIASITNAKKKTTARNPYLSPRLAAAGNAAPSTSKYLNPASPAATVSTVGVSSPSSLSTIGTAVSPYAMAVERNRLVATAPAAAAASVSNIGTSSVVTPSPAAVSHHSIIQNDNDKMIYDSEGKLKGVGSIEWSNPHVWSLLAEHKCPEGDDVPSDLESQINLGIKVFTPSQMIVAVSKVQSEVGITDMEFVSTRKAQAKWFADFYAKHNNMSISSSTEALKSTASSAAR